MRIKENPKEGAAGAMKQSTHPPTLSKSETYLAGEALEIPSIIHRHNCMTAVLDAVMEGVALRKTGYQQVGRSTILCDSQPNGRMANVLAISQIRTERFWAMCLKDNIIAITFLTFYANLQRVVYFKQHQV